MWIIEIKKYSRIFQRNAIFYWELPHSFFISSFEICIWRPNCKFFDIDKIPKNLCFELLCVPLTFKFICRSPNPQWDGSIWRWGFRELTACLDKVSGTSIMGLAPSRRRPWRVCTLARCHVRTQWEGGLGRVRKRALTRIRLCWNLDLGLSGSRTRRKWTSVL